LNRLVLITAICGLLASPALAQNQGGPAKASGVPDAEKLQKSAESIDKMKSSLKSVLSRVEEARNEKDVVKLNCVNEKQAQIKGLLKVAEQAEVSLKDALASKDPAANAEFSKIGIAKSKVDGLGNDATQCIGQLAYIVDEKTTVEVIQPPGQPDRDTTGQVKQRPPPAMPVVLRPPPASSFN
jgi:hypothetical protein